MSFDFQYKSVCFVILLILSLTTLWSFREPLTPTSTIPTTRLDIQKSQNTSHNPILPSNTVNTSNIIIKKHLELPTKKTTNVLLRNDKKDRMSIFVTGDLSHNKNIVLQFFNSCFNSSK